MRARLNSMFFTQSAFDSASPVGSAVVAHRFDDEGDYDVHLGRAKEPPERVVLTVGPAAADRSSGAVGVTIDTAPARSDAAADRRGRLTAGGYASFSTPSARGVDSVIVARRQGAEVDEFDSRRLGPGDVYGLTLVRPGVYSVRNTLGDATGRIVVDYPVVGSRPYRPAEPVRVSCARNGLAPSEIRVGPGHGIVFDIETDARLIIDLVEPDDGPNPRPRGRRARHRRAE